MSSQFFIPISSSHSLPFPIMSEFIGHIDLKSWCREVRLSYPLNDPVVDLITLVRMDLSSTVDKFVEEMGMSV